MKLPDIRDFDLKGKRVLLRTDLDVPLRAKSPQGKLEIADDTRIQETIPTVNHLLAKGVKLVILAHLGRPDGKINPSFSLGPIADHLGKLLGRKVSLVSHPGKIEEELALLENLRFWPGEEENDSAFAWKLAAMGEFYVNDAFACSHRQHASVVFLPGLLPHAAGLDLLEEVRVLSQVREKPKRPVVVIIGGVKKDKIEAIPGLMAWADLVLIGGKLVSYPEIKKIRDHKKRLAVLSKTSEDITLESAVDFIDRVREAGTVVWSGPLGQYEDKRFEKGTKLFAEAMAGSSAFRVVGGGETVAALTSFGLEEKIDFVSSGGGAMLSYLANGDLPGLKALREIKK